MIILLPPVFLNFPTASESLNSSSSTFPNRLHRQYLKSVAAPHKSDTIAAVILWPLLIKNTVFFNAKNISLANKEHTGSPSIC